jgi:hypothetical protein
MSEQIEVGDGYRLIDKQKDTKQQGDEYWSDSFNEWVVAWNDGVFHSEHVYRRRIPAKPEAMEIEAEAGLKSWVKKDNSVIIEQENESGELECVLLWTTQSIRQLADWLTRYADWREAQKN